MDSSGKELDEIRIVHIDYSEYRVQTVYKCHDAKMIDFYPDDPHFIVLIEDHRGPVL